MTMREALKCVVEAVHAITNVYGSPDDQEIVEKFVKQPNAASPDDYGHVSGIPLRSFYAYSSQGFGGTKDSLWMEIQQRSGVNPLPQPKNWNCDTRLGQLAVYVEAFANP